MATPTQKLNDWNEYKLLVLAELERLNECIDKLQAGHNKLNELIVELKRDHKEATNLINAVDKRIDTAHPPMSNTQSLIPDSKWKFYAAVIGLVATAIAAFASLITILWQHTHDVAP